MNDHNGLRYLFDQLKLNSRQAKWLATINDFEFYIMYIKRKGIWVVYALSRRVHVNHITIMSSYGTNLQYQIL